MAGMCQVSQSVHHRQFSGWQNGHNVCQRGRIARRCDVLLDVCLSWMAFLRAEYVHLLSMNVLSQICRECEAGLYPEGR